MKLFVDNRFEISRSLIQCASTPTTPLTYLNVAAYIVLMRKMKELYILNQKGTNMYMYIVLVNMYLL